MAELKLVFNLISLDLKTRLSRTFVSVEDNRWICFSPISEKITKITFNERFVFFFVSIGFSLQLFLLEEMRERRYDHYARVIQKVFCRYFAKRQRQRQRELAAGKQFLNSFFFSGFENQWKLGRVKFERNHNPTEISLAIFFL